MSQKEPLFRGESEASPTGLQTGFPLDISLVRCHFDSCIFKDKFIESGTFLGLRGDCSCFWMSVLLGWLKDQRLEMIRVFFLPVGTWRHAFLGTAAYCLIPSAACAVGARGGTM